VLFETKGFQRLGHIVPTIFVISLRQVKLDYHPPSSLAFQRMYKLMGMDDVVRDLYSFYETRLFL
jgi:hypothetical protein